ncbi:hypothetical protein BS50DRAFT_593611 [Corynespora cassiicola Philippines]|uniref:NB-ARC domain-containing protein n=1 Tax=Corynespora cassiicola Philippines TaxID=1448308 RepID=A0A2T2N4Y4_CORCC|nr:hypothetical protein BS50DRAFT_593611 [Corynespora cassiicola Philippines]
MTGHQRAEAAGTFYNTCPWPESRGRGEAANHRPSIVAIHGLNGHRDETWTAANGTHWLRDLLPNDLPNARIFCWGYDANTHGKRVSHQFLHDHAEELVSDLCRRRKRTDVQALIHSDAARKGALEEHRSIKTSTYGIIFMGTPHQGGNGVHFGKLLVNAASIHKTTNSQLLEHLERDSEWLQQQLRQYGPISGEFVTKFAYEEYKTPTALGHSIIVVPKASAVVPGSANAEQIMIHADHREMVKFESEEDSDYEKVSDHLIMMVEAAGSVVSLRWEEEIRVDAARSNLGQNFSVIFSLSEASETNHFVARQTELATMHEALSGGTDRNAVTLHGLGGIGKTQLAIAYIKAHRDNYSAIFWLNIKDEVSVKQSYLRLAKRILQDCPSASQLGVFTDDKRQDDVMAAVKRWLEHAKNTQWLVVFDNYDNPKVPGNTDPGAVDIRQFLPETYHGSVIITTRSSKVNVGRRMKVGKLEDVRDSLQILSDASHREGVIDDPNAAELAKELDGLPLALATAGAYLDQVATSFQGYLRLYKASWLKLQQTTPQLSSYEDRQLFTTWQLSYDHIKRQNKFSARLLQLWAYFDNQDLWFELLQEQNSSGPEWFARLAEDELSFHEAMRVLCNHGLAEADSSSEMDEIESTGYSMHTCVHEWTTHVLNQEWSKELARLSLYCVSLHVPVINAKGSWKTQRRLMQHASRCWSSVKAGKVEKENGLPVALGNLGNLFSTLSKLEEAEQMFDWALHGFQDALGANHVLTLHIVNSMGDLYTKQGKLIKAEKMYERALHGFETALGPNDTDTLNTFNCLGILYRRLDKLGEAEKMYQRALQGYKRALGPEDMTTINIANNLGLLYFDQRRLGEAEEMYLLALHGFEKSLGHNHPSTLNVVNNLGMLFAVQEQLEPAVEMYKRALQGKVNALGIDHSSTLGTINNMGMLYANHGRLNEAKEMYLQALKGKEKAFGPDHMSTLGTVNNLGMLYVAYERLDEAEEMFLRALRGKENALGPGHTSTLNTVNNLALVYKMTGKENEAWQLYARFPKTTTG